MLAVPITEESLYRNSDIVKIVHDLNGNVLYTSRQPIPYCDEFSPDLGALRVGGIFGFRWHMLKWFTGLPESPLERVEACDSNRICDNGRFQRIAPISARAYYSVDSPEDVELVEYAIADDPLWESIDRISANRHELRKQGRSFLLSTAIAVFIAEWSVRLALPVYDPAGHVVWQTHPRAGTVLGQPGTTARQIKNSGDYNVSVRFNRHGFRDRQDVSTGHARDIYLVGDSFAFGWGRRK